MSIISCPGSEIITAFGVVDTIKGALDLASSRIQSGIKSIFFGLSSVNIGGRLLGLNSKTRSGVVKGSLSVGVGVAGVHRASRLINGMKQKNTLEILKGGIQTVVAIAGAAFIHNLDSKVVAAANDASILALSSSFVAKMGLTDLSKGRYLMGLSKILLGAGGLASAGYYLCSFGPLKQTGAEEQLAFLKDHDLEIERICDERSPTGKWEFKGGGISKKVFAHPGLPGMVIKVPAYGVSVGHRTRTGGEGDLLLNYENYQSIRDIAQKYGQIVIPESRLHRTAAGKLIIVEEMLRKFVDYDSVPRGALKQEAEFRFNQFLGETGLCDVRLKENHNAAFLPGKIPKIAIFDFDCTI